MSLKKHFEDLRGQTGGAQGKAAICCDIFKVQEREAVSDTHTRRPEAFYQKSGEAPQQLSL